MRTILPTLAIVMLVLTTGCLTPLIGDDLSFESTPVTISEDALAATGYTAEAPEEAVIEETVTVLGDELTITVTNWMTGHSKAAIPSHLEGVAGGDAAMATVMTMSTPQIEVHGHALNPVGRMEIEELLLQSEDISELSNLEKVDEQTLTVLGETTTVETFHATATMAAVEMDVAIHAARVAHGDDYVIAVGVHPVAIDETENVHRLLENLEHDATDTDASKE